MFAFLRRNKSAPKTSENYSRLEGVSLGKNDIAIDCGANVGEVTEQLCANGATVYAFEPNPHAFQVLQARFAARPNVFCINKGVLDAPGIAKLYLHRNASQDQVYWPQGGSLLEHKGNVNPNTFVEVELVDLADFIRNLDHPVRLLKIDVEGVECRILTRLIRCGLVGGIGRILVETHERRIPSLVPEVEALRRLIAEQHLQNIDLDWH